MTKNKRHYYNELTFNSKLQLLTTTGTNRPVEPSSRWFKGNSRFKSPMLQMHKGDKFDLNCEINSLICEYLQLGLLALFVFV